MKRVKLIPKCPYCRQSLTIEDQLSGFRVHACDPTKAIPTGEFICWRCGVRVIKGTVCCKCGALNGV